MDVVRVDASGLGDASEGTLVDVLTSELTAATEGGELLGDVVGVGAAADVVGDVGDGAADEGPL